MNPPPPNKNSDRSLVTAFLLLLVFITPFVSIWSSGQITWYAPYVIWLGIVMLIAISLRSEQGDDREP